MLLLCALEELDSHRYWHSAHPVQELVRQAVVSLLEVDLEHSIEVLDGCGVPTLCVFLENLALGYQHLAEAIKHEQESPLGTVGTAMLQNPVSYTHLDVYKRQALILRSLFQDCRLPSM